MKIEIKSNDTKAVQTLIIKILELNNKSINTYDYLANDTLYIGLNENSGFNYIYLESTPSISLCTNNNGELCIVYSSGLDGIEFIKYNLDNITSLTDLEDVINNAYTLEDSIRDDDYQDTIKTDKFIEAMNANGWDEL